MSHHPVEDSNCSANLDFSSVLASLISRRTLLRGSASAAALGAAPGLLLSGCDDSNNNGAAASKRLGFAPVAKSLEDRVVLPAGYSARVLYALGDPLAAGIAEYPNDGSDDGNWDQRAGDHHDGMAYYPFPKGSGSASEGLLVLNHEALTDVYLHAGGPTSIEGVRPLAEVQKEQFAHGVSVIRVVKSASGWSVDRSATQNRRWHVNSPMQISGPAAGSALLVTKQSPDGTATYGTLNNCGHGVTPWGTYLTGEENWFAYFVVDAQSDTDALGRYGIKSSSPGFNYRGWDTPLTGGDLQKRFNVSQTGATAASDFRNEPNHFGYVVEINPYDPDATPKKRSALGRFSHEGAWFAPAVAGQPLAVYMGDDARNEYIYKFVSAANWDPADAAGGLEVGDKYLDEGTLYVAQFNADGSGAWLVLDQSNPALADFSAEEIAVYTRQAADAAGGTKMDRPEWGTVNPLTGEVFVTLTNSSSSSSGRGQGGSGSQPVDAANPRSYDRDTGSLAEGVDGNVNGHIIRWRETNGSAAATSFRWDIFLFGSRASYPVNVNVSALTDDNDFSSPDGLWCDPRGVLWIQTDDGAYTQPTANDPKATNCMMLAALPGSVGDGAAVTLGTQNTFVGALPTAETLARFLVGVPGCEITGVDLTPDYKTMFVNIQHPGESGDLTEFQSNWPNASGNALELGVADTRPRTSTIVITRDDGGTIGL
ncbi:MAG: PhoX family phosphatase [Sinimarinibacterium sp.]